MLVIPAPGEAGSKGGERKGGLGGVAGPVSKMQVAGERLSGGAGLASLRPGFHSQGGGTLQEAEAAEPSVPVLHSRWGGPRGLLSPEQ